MERLRHGGSYRSQAFVGSRPGPSAEAAADYLRALTAAAHGALDRYVGLRQETRKSLRSDACLSTQQFPVKRVYCAVARARTAVTGTLAGAAISSGPRAVGDQDAWPAAEQGHRA